MPSHEEAIRLPRVAAAVLLVSTHFAAALLLFSLLLSVVSLTGLAEGSSCPDCGAKALCARHAAEEKAAVEAFKSAMKDKSPEKRVAAIGELAKVNAGHDNARSKAAAQVMLIALKDPALPVRAEAARQLGATQDPAIVFKALSDETDRELKKFAAMDLKKARGTAEYADELLWLGALYTGLCAGKNRQAAPCVAQGLEMMNADVVHLAADHVEQVHPRAVIDSLLVALSHLGAANPNAEVNAAWLVVCAALPKVTGNKTIAPQKDAADTFRFVGDWQDWWKANRSRKEFE